MTEIVKDYLGHPCKTAEAFERFEECVSDARKLTGAEPREISRRIGRALNDLQDRLEHQWHAIGAVRDALHNNTDNDAAASILEMAEAYSIDSSSKFSEFAGLVLLALEVGGLHAPAKKEVGHGQA